MAIGNKINGLTSKVDYVNTIMDGASQMANALEQSDAVQKIERGIQRFADNIPWLMKSLDEVAKVHPAVTGTCRKHTGLQA